MMMKYYRVEVAQLDTTFDYAKLKAFMEKQKKRYHENHSFIFAIKLKLAVMIGDQGLRHISNALLTEKILYLKEAVKMIKLLMPC